MECAYIKYKIEIMKKLSVVLLFVLALCLSSCVESSKKYQQMQAKLDSLTIANDASNAEYNDAMKTLNEIEMVMAEVRQSENLLLVQAQEGDGNTAVAEIKALQDLINKNKQKITDLESKLSNSSKANSSLKTTIARLKTELEEKDQYVETLKQELVARNIKIDELNQQVTGLTGNIDSLASLNLRQNEVILSQETALNMVWYCVGSRRELKDMGVISGRDVMPNGANGFFTSVDKREFTFLPLASKKANILTSHPDGSYELVKGEDKTLTLKILDKESFWSVSRYLIISVK